MLEEIRKHREDIRKRLDEMEKKLDNTTDHFTFAEADDELQGILDDFDEFHSILETEVEEWQGVNNLYFYLNRKNRSRLDQRDAR